MSKEIKVKDDTASDYIAVGDTFNDKTITEIWCTSTGTVMFCIDNNHDRYITYNQLIDEICEPEPEFTTEYMEEYKSVTHGR